jgi:hypothetical protein
MFGTNALVLPLSADIQPASNADWFEWRSGSAILRSTQAAICGLRNPYWVGSKGSEGKPRLAQLERSVKN